METLLTALIYGLLIIFGGLIPKIKEILSEKKLKEQVCWCVASDYERGFPLTDIVYNQFAKLEIDYKYSLDIDDKPIVKEIIEIHNEYLSSLFLKQELKIDNRFAKLSCEEYFLFSLNAFLRKHQCEKYFNDNQMYEAKVTRDYGNLCFDEEYKLLDYGIIFNKLYLITEIFCEKHKKINFHGYYLSSSGIKKALDNGTMNVSTSWK